MWRNIFFCVSWEKWIKLYWTTWEWVNDVLLIIWIFIISPCCTTLAVLVLVRVIVSVHVFMCMNVYKWTPLSTIDTEKRKNPWNRCLDHTSEMASTVRLYQIWPRLKHQALSVHKYLENFQGQHQVTRNLSFLWIFLYE